MFNNASEWVTGSPLSARCTFSIGVVGRPAITLPGLVDNPRAIFVPASDLDNTFMPPWLSTFTLNSVFLVPKKT